MRIRCARRPYPARRFEWAFTLTEAAVSAGLFSLVIVSMLGSNLAGLRFNQFVQPKLQNAQYCRTTLGRMIEEVRSANSLQVGTGTFSSFVLAGPANAQGGNALKIFPTTNTTQYTYYYRDPGTRTLLRMQLPATNVTTVATGVTNATVFTFENYAGTTLTNAQNNAVMNVLLQLRRNSDWAGISDAVQVRTRVTRRTIL